MSAWRAWLALGVVLALAAAFWAGWAKRGEFEAGRQARAALVAQVAQVSAANALARKEVQRLEAVAARDAAARELEDQANAQPVDDACGIGAERVRRLNLR